ncbi:hypothetical protein AAFF_G00388030 [Aldrovandia affinis]|uniref:Uncharacterized protein n=1 Tax=Aldrovandia affinis TaxID=143900 RepID=A0AAD7SES6_9TELE|nr:hypothetical protein AAFF_G00388030 [Aldrovandia affinis]
MKAPISSAVSLIIRETIRRRFISVGGSRPDVSHVAQLTPIPVMRLSPDGSRETVGTRREAHPGAGLPGPPRYRGGRRRRSASPHTQMLQIPRPQPSEARFRSDKQLSPGAGGRVKGRGRRTFAIAHNQPGSRRCHSSCVSAHAGASGTGLAPALRDVTFLTHCHTGAGDTHDGRVNPPA